jgi:uncharacterized protein YciI
MGLYAVRREAGPGWSKCKSAFEQPGVAEHSDFMNALAATGALVFGGALGGSERDRVRVLAIMEASDEADVRRKLADDPWARSARLVTTSVEPWLVLAGQDRLPAPPQGAVAAQTG